MGTNATKAIVFAGAFFTAVLWLVVLGSRRKHGAEEARELYADVWLGFSEVEIDGFLRRAGFSEVEVSQVHREDEAPHLETLLALAHKP